MRTRRRYEEQDWSLPWPIETVFWVIGLLCVPIGMWWITNEITSPAKTLGQMLGLPVDIQMIVQPFRPIILIFGIIIGVRVRCALRRMFVKRLDGIA